MVALPFGPIDLMTDGAPDAALIAAFLRSGRPISPEIREWLARLLDPEPRQNVSRLQVVKARGRPRSVLPHAEAVDAYRTAREAGSMRKVSRGIAEVQAKRGRATMDAAIKAQDEAEAENFQLVAQEGSPKK